MKKNDARLENYKVGRVVKCCPAVMMIAHLPLWSPSALLQV